MFSRTFLWLTALLALLLSVAAHPLYDERSLLHEFDSRQVSTNTTANVTVNATVCARVDINIPIAARVCVNALNEEVTVVGLTIPVGITCRNTGATLNVNLGTNVCLCLKAGVLTDASVGTLTNIANNGTLTALLTQPYAGQAALFTSTSLLARLRTDLTAQIGNRSTTCQYDPNATPTSCDNCDFTCPSGYQICGRTCILDSSTCISGGMRKRYQWSTEERCRRPLTACAIPGSHMFDGTNFECIDTRSDIESCGACAFPLPGQKAGVDCTAIANSVSVGCLRGNCQVNKCEKGYEPSEDKAACVPTTIQHQIQQAKTKERVINKRQVKTETLRKRAPVPARKRSFLGF